MKKTIRKTILLFVVFAFALLAAGRALADDGGGGFDKCALRSNSPLYSQIGGVAIARMRSATVHITKKEGNWLQVMLVSGDAHIRGWIPKKYCR